ncbi:MAG TPA: hypothetical protein DCG12_17895 [Planctomycetaceae bacterium]|nr:hypothetical protein [Planctomycetaceae bacterium]
MIAESRAECWRRADTSAANVGIPEFPTTFGPFGFPQFGVRRDDHFRTQAFEIRLPWQQELPEKGHLLLLTVRCSRYKTSLVGRKKCQNFVLLILQATGDNQAG